jgi:hypothetical protein
MTAYCDLDDIYPLIPTLGPLLDASTGPPIVLPTIPTETQGEALIDSSCAEINGLLAAAGYELPITDAGALDYLKVVNSYGGAAFILRAKYPTADKPGGGASATTFWTNRYYASLDALKLGAIGGAAVVKSSFSHGFRDSDGDAIADSDIVSRTDRETGF